MYPINDDPEPELVTKKPTELVEYVQELAIRYLRPGTPPVPGEIVITQEPSVTTGAAPPVIIRQQPPRPHTPEPLVIREAPPHTPAPIHVKRVTIAGKANTFSYIANDITLTFTPHKTGIFLEILFKIRNQHEILRKKVK